MSEFGNIAEGASAALSEVTPYERGEQVVAPEPTPALPEPTQAPVDPAVSQPQVDLDNLPAPDLSSLDPVSRAAAEQAIRQYQSMATPKLQEAAQLRKLSEQYGGQEKVQQVLDFYQRLDTDRDFARQVYDQLGTALDANGQPAQQQVPVTQVAPTEPTNPEFDLNDLPPEIATAYRQMQDMQNNVQQVLQQQEQQRYQAEILAQYTRDEQAILTANPSYGKADMDAIYSLAYSNGGDLNAAHTYYQQVEQQMISRYMQGKENAPSPIPSGVRGDVPTTTKDASMKTIREGAIEMLRNEMAQ